jgi:hypothetical protein
MGKRWLAGWDERMGGVEFLKINSTIRFDEVE